MIVLCVAHAAFEAYLMAAACVLIRPVVRDLRPHLLAPPTVIDGLPAEIREIFVTVRGDRLPCISGSPLSDIKGAIAFRRVLATLAERPTVVWCGAWRSTATSYLRRFFGSQIPIFAFRQGAHENPALFPRRRRILESYQNALYAVFGSSGMRVFSAGDSRLLTMLEWMRDPVNTVGVLSNEPNSPLGPNEHLLPPPFNVLGGLFPATRQEPAVLLAGERVPLFESAGANEQAIYGAVLDYLRREFHGYRLCFKPRPGFTDMSGMDLSGFDILPGDVPMEDILLRRSFSAVISVKSTASKLGAIYNQPSCVLYPLFDLPPGVRAILDDFFRDTPSIVKINRLSDLTPTKLRPVERDDATLSQSYRSFLLPRGQA